MATRFFTRCLLTPSKQTLTSMFSRSFTSLPLGKTPQSLPASSFYLRPLVAIAPCLRHISVASSVRCFATRQTSSSLNDPNPNWSNRPPKETILLDGCDFEHWLVVMEKPEGEPTRDEIIDSYIKTLAQVVGSEDEARMKIYSVSTKHYFAFGALVSEELSYKLKELSRVRWVLPDSYLDVKNKDYGGEPFINGQAVPYDEKYHAEWVRNNARANERNRRNDRPRNYDRSRNFDRRRDVQMVNQNAGANMGPGGPGGPQNMGPNNTGYLPPNNIGGVPPNNMGGVPPNNMGGVAPNRGGMPSNNMGGVPSNMGGQQPSNYTGQQPSNYTGQQPSNYTGQQPSNYTGQQPSNYTGQQPSNYTGQQPSNYTGQQPSNYTGQQPSNYTGQPPSNYTGQQSSNYTGQPPSNYTGQQPSNYMGQQPSNYTGQQPANYMGGQAGLNYGGMPHNNTGGAPNNAPNSGEAPYQSGPGPNQNNYAPNVAGGNPYQNQNQNMPGRDIPPAQNKQ